MVNNRLEYIDALRGFTMILVVFAHVEIFSFFSFSYETYLGSFFQSFRMPLFFFISGFVANLSLERRTFSINNEICKKIRILLIPTFFWGIIYTCFCLQKNIEFFYNDAAKAGYWYMLVSFQIFLCYFLCLRFAREEKKREKVLVCMALLFLIFKLPLKHYEILCELGNLTSIHYTFEYFHYFVFGLLASKYREKYHLYIEKKWIITIVIVLFCICFYLKSTIVLVDVSVSNILLKFMLKFALGYMGIIWIYKIARKSEKYVSINTKIGKFLNYIGKRTLDIYVLHYFLLPFIPSIGDYLKLNPNMVLELIVGMFLSLIIVIICIIISNMIRMSPILAYYLLGHKTK